MRTIMILNSKGGAGKTTLATNLAGYYAKQGKVVALKDFDPQGSSISWLDQRIASRPKIHGIAASRQAAGLTSSWMHRLPAQTDVQIIDSPAGVDLQKLLMDFRNADKVIIPVIPSPIDIRASAMFIKNLMKFIRIYRCGVDIGVVASRVTRRGSAFFSMKRLFRNLDIPYLATFNESEHYIRAAERGISIHEMPHFAAGDEQLEWLPLFDWIECTQEDQVETTHTRSPTLSAAY